MRSLSSRENIGVKGRMKEKGTQYRIRHDSDPLPLPTFPPKVSQKPTKISTSSPTLPPIHSSLLPPPSTTPTDTPRKDLQHNRRGPHKHQPRVLAPRAARVELRVLGRGQGVRHRGAGGEIPRRRPRVAGVEGEVLHGSRCSVLVPWGDGSGFCDVDCGAGGRVA